ncbi:hypothetical protein [Rhizobium terrae]|uniref:hypothetical protein n=1 Tax=Rhizobium terrae TaxID=2171756 RepID=UPI0013C2EA9E|nr:hypothetical protein [Rhizobium terrae]
MAAASTAAVASPACAAPAENPKLIELADALPAVAEAYHTAYRAYEEMHERHKAATPLAPDEMTDIGIGCPRTTSQPGEVEMNATLGYLYRKGEKFPRRIVRNSWQVRCEIDDYRRIKRQAKKTGDVAEYLRAEETIVGLKAQLAEIEAYEEAYRAARAAAHDDHERLYPIREQALHALADHISALMAEPDWTMEGLMIKAEALIVWNHLDRKEKIYGHLLGADWHASIAKSILHHAEAGAA